MIRLIKKFRYAWALAFILLLTGSLILQAQTFYGKRRTGFYATREDGAPFGYYIPRAITEDKKVPLVVIFSKKATAVMKWKNLADENQFIAVAIQPKLGGVWNFEWDVDRAMKKVKELLGWYPIDADRILATGYESGGTFALIMAINHPEMFAAGAASDAKTADVKLLRGDVDSNEYVAPFAYQKDTAKHRPLWLLNYTESEYVKPEELQKTRELLDEFGYSVTYETVEGEPHSPSQKIVQNIYRWFENQAV